MAIPLLGGIRYALPAPLPKILQRAVRALLAQPPSASRQRRPAVLPWATAPRVFCVTTGSAWPGDSSCGPAIRAIIGRIPFLVLRTSFC